MERYYTPEISEFHVGFEYEMKEGFTDGIVKSQKDFDNAEWAECIADSGIMYIERALHGKNSTNGLCGIRVKYLDRNDIENCGWVYRDTNEGGTDYFWSTGEDNSLIHNYYNCWTVITLRDSIRREDYTAFAGYIKNISEIKKLMAQLKIK